MQIIKPMIYFPQSRPQMLMELDQFIADHYLGNEYEYEAYLEELNFESRLQQIREPDIRDIIEAYSLHQLNEHIPTRDELIEAKDNHATLEQVHTDIEYLVSFTMDFNLIIILFSNMSPENIIYVGDAHAINIGRLLEALGFELLSIEEFHKNHVVENPDF